MRGEWWEYPWKVMEVGRHLNAQGDFLTIDEALDFFEAPWHRTDAYVDMMSEDPS